MSTIPVPASVKAPDGNGQDKELLQVLFHAIEHLDLEPGSDCPACGRRVPTAKKDDSAGPRRQTMSVSVPRGEEGILDDLLIQLVDKYRDQWPREYASMRDGLGLEAVGGRSWKYFALHFAVWACLMVPGLEPVEEG